MILLRINAPLISELLVILGLAIIFILVLRRLKLPSVIGFLLAGAMCGTNGINLHDYVLMLPDFLAGPLFTNLPAYIAPPQEDVEILAEVGVVLLLFTIGLEFSVSNLLRLKKVVLLGGTLQVALTIAVFAGVTYFLSYDYLPIAIFIGFLFALSSTAIVLKLLQESGDINKEHGQTILAILIFQDVAVVPMMLVLPMLGGGDLAEIPMQVLILLGKLMALVVFVYLLAKYIIPYLLFQIAKAQSKDLFIVSVVALCFMIAYITGFAGLSFALGAFLAGLIISESKYSHQVVGSIIYFKELFTSIFFISVGLMLDIVFLMNNWLVILSFTFVVIVLKALVGGLVAKWVGGSPRTIITVALCISQVGEFSFILMKMGELEGLMPIELYQYFLSVSVFTMMLSPVLIHYSNNIVYFLGHYKFIPKGIRRWVTGSPSKPKTYNTHKEQLKDHLVVVGHNLTARTLVHGAKKMGIPYVIIELDPEIVEAEHKKGEPIIYGDATNEEVLHHAQIEKCNIVVIASSNMEEASTYLHAIKLASPNAYVITRTYTSIEADILMKEGADLAVSDEMQSNIEILIGVLDYLGLSTKEAMQFSSYIREESVQENNWVVEQERLKSEEKPYRWMRIFS